jgi:hypothetical protein
VRLLDHEKRTEHLALLKRALDLKLRQSTREAFADMLEDMTMEVFQPCACAPPRWRLWSLSRAQELWVLKVLGVEPAPEPTRLTDGGIPRGREVPTPAVLRNLPMKPPGRA